MFWLGALALGSVAGTFVKIYPSDLLVAALYVYFFVLDTGLIFLYLRTLRGNNVAWAREGVAVGVMWLVLLVIETVLVDILWLGFSASLIYETWPSYLIMVLAGLVAGLIADARFDIKGAGS